MNFFIFLLCVILDIVFEVLTITAILNSDNYGDGYNGFETNLTFIISALITLIFIVIFAISFEIIGIILTVKTNALKDYYSEYGSLWILF